MRAGCRQWLHDCRIPLIQLTEIGYSVRFEYMKKSKISSQLLPKLPSVSLFSMSAYSPLHPESTYERTQSPHNHAQKYKRRELNPRPSAC